MSELQWIKLYVDIFTNSRKIKKIERLKNGDTYLVIWIKFLCLAGATNDSGKIYITPDIPFELEDLADELNHSEAVVKKALNIFESYGMIERNDAGFIRIASWERYQKTETLDRIREQNRIRVAAHRERKREEMESQICQYCGEPATGYDHIVATARGGENIDSNKVPCCKKCNNIKNDKPVVDFLNNNRDRISDAIVTSNHKLRKFVTLCNVTNRYIVTDGNAIERENKNKNNIYNTLSTERVDAKSVTKSVTNGLLSEEALRDLQSCGIPDDYIEFYFKKVEKRGYQYDDHASTILSWWQKDKHRWCSPPSETEESSFDTDEFFEAALRRSYGDQYDEIYGNKEAKL